MRRGWTISAKARDSAVSAGNAVAAITAFLVAVMAVMIVAAMAAAMCLMRVVPSACAEAVCAEVRAEACAEVRAEAVCAEACAEAVCAEVRAEAVRAEACAEAVCAEVRAEAVCAEACAEAVCAEVRAEAIRAEACAEAVCAEVRAEAVCAEACAEAEPARQAEQSNENQPQAERLQTELPQIEAEMPLAADITKLCRFTGASKHSRASSLYDGGYSQAFTAQADGLTITAPEGSEIAALYLCHNSLPLGYEILSISTSDGGERRLLSRDAEYLHELVSFEPCHAVRVRATSGCALKLDELRVFTWGALPEDVQRWQPTYDRCDILLLVAHPDDELLFFGGLIPWYESVGTRVLVATMTCRSALRAHELLDGLWTAGERHYPDIGALRDRATRDISVAYDAWTREDADYRFVKLVRERKPAVIVTHGVKGEYGHGAHKACADIALRLFYKCADANYLPQLSALYGAHQPQKLYLHQYAQNALHMDWSRDIGGRTAADAAREAFQMHRSQYFFDMQLSPDSPYCAMDFGLAESTVGADIQKDDLMENVREEE